MPSAQYMHYYKYLDDRDFILVEQRGNSYAKPHLDCPEWANATAKSRLPNFNLNTSDSLFVSATKKCRERLVKKGIDLNGYNTNEIAADINDLVETLNIKEYNLLTISYSTKIAQVLLRDYPEKIRSVVMDSPLPLEVSYDEESVGNLLEIIKTITKDCQYDNACNTTFPNLSERLFSYLRDKSKNPLEVSVINPNTNTLETFYLKGKDLVGILAATPADQMATIPIEITKVLNGDLSSIEYYLTTLFEDSVNDGSGQGMRLSVWCSEEYPFNSQDIITRETNRYPEVKGLSPTTFKASVCDIWSVQKVPPIENEAIKTSIPVLLINGEYDHLTPVKWARNMKKNLRNSHHLIFKGWKHTPTTNWSNTCAMEAANDFFNDPSKLPNSKCLKRNKKLKFKTNNN